MPLEKFFHEQAVAAKLLRDRQLKAIEEVLWKPAANMQHGEALLSVHVAAESITNQSCSRTAITIISVGIDESDATFRDMDFEVHQCMDAMGHL